MKKILILLPGPFLKRDYIRFGIETLKKNFLVKAVDLTAWLHPELWQEYSKIVFKSEDHVVISCKKDFLTLLNEINPAIIFDQLHDDKKTNWIRQQIKTNKKNLLVKLNANLIPFERSNIIKTSKKLFYLFLKPRQFIYTMVKILKEKYYSLRKNNPDITIVGSLAAKKKSKAKITVNAHSMDYDIYLDIKNKPINNENPYAVFLDGDLVTHPDILYLRLKALVNEFQYYPVLIKFLKKFEIETGLQIKFAVHPKSRNKNLPNLLKDIDYSIGNTAELVKNSSAVLLHSTTALSYAILFKKPAIFLTSNQLKKSYRGTRIDTFAKVVNGQIINMDNELTTPLDLQNLLKIDESKYKNYLDQYLKVPNSPDVPLWEIFTNYIKSNQFGK